MIHTTVAVPDTISEKAAAFSQSPIATITKITDGSINETYEVSTKDGKVFILQKMSSIFEPSVMDNLAVVQPSVQTAQVLVPEGLPTIAGDAYVLNGGDAWYRALSYIPGSTIHDHIGTTRAHSAAKLAGRFHSALANLDVTLVEAVRHFHDTKFYAQRLQTIVKKNSDTEKDASLRPIAATILERLENITIDTRSLPQRIIHADLKVSNIRFNEEDEAIALIDMDTMMHGSIAVEMGDALRSWCGTAGEDSPDQVFDEEVCNTALAGYQETANAITEEEIASIPEGIALLTLELAARFTADAYEETYFAQSSHYPNLYIQNKTKAENQLKFLDAFESKRSLIKT